MSSSAATLPKLTPQEYVLREELAASKSEYIDGHVYAMAGASARHATIQMNLYAELGLQLRGKTCRAFASDLKVWAPAAKAFFYQDLSVACEAPQYFAGSTDALENPVFILEVLSPSTQNFDRTRKFGFYRSIPSFRQYVLVSQDEPRVEVFTRDSQGFWIFTDYSDLSATADFGIIGAQVPLAAIYDRVEFESSPGAPRE